MSVPFIDHRRVSVLFAESHCDSNRFIQLGNQTVVSMRETIPIRITVVGAGYVGLTCAAVLSKAHEVTLIDKDNDRIHAIAMGEAPILEPGLDELIKEGLESGRLFPKTVYEVETPQNLTMICVGTPSDSQGSANLTYIQSVMDELEDRYESFYGNYPVIALRSTVPPGTTRELVFNRLLKDHNPDSFGVIYCPEFLAQGGAIRNLLAPDRMVIGSTSQKATRLYVDVFSESIDKRNFPVCEMSLESAELCKLASNYFLALKISYANEMATLTELIPFTNIDDVLRGVTADYRIHPSHLGAGLGFGGSCFPKDTGSLLSFGNAQGVNMQILQSVIQVNNDVSTRLIRLLDANVQQLTGAKVAVLGLTFKAGTDDIRNSPSIDLIRHLKARKAKVWAHDSNARIDDAAKSALQDVHLCSSLNECVNDADVVVLMTDWPEYIELGLAHLVGEGQLFVDGRRAFVNSSIPQGVTYRALGSFEER